MTNEDKAQQKPPKPANRPNEPPQHQREIRTRSEPRRGWRKIPDTYFRTLGPEHIAERHQELSPAAKLRKTGKSGGTGIQKGTAKCRL